MFGGKPGQLVVARTIRLRDWTDDQFRKDTCDAFNMLKFKKLIHPQTSYSLIYVNHGKVTEGVHARTGEYVAGTNPKVRMILHFEGEEEPVYASCFDVDPVELIVGAGPLEVVRGKSDYV